VTFAFNYTAEDYWGAQKLFIRTTQLTNAKLILLFVANLVFAAIAYQFACQDHWFLSLLAIGGIGVNLWVPIAMKSHFRKEFLHTKRNQLPIEIRLSEESFHSKYQDAEAEVNWEMFGAWMEDSSMLMIVPRDSRLFFMFPKRLLTKEEIEAIKDLFAKHVKQ
jgi:hypothetical protein